MTGTNYEDLSGLPCLQMISELNNIPQLSASDPDSNMPSKVNFDYYSISDFSSSVDIQIYRNELTGLLRLSNKLYYQSYLF